MKVSPINAGSNVCTFTIELTWQQAEALHALGPSLLSAIGAALSQRQADGARQTQRRKDLEQVHAAQRAEWAALASDCEEEISRRSNNGPSSRRALIKQLAAERGMATEFLSSILRVYRRTDQSKQIGSRIGQARRLRDAGYTHKEIGEKLGVTDRQVRNYLDGKTRQPKTPKSPLVQK